MKKYLRVVSFLALSHQFWAIAAHQFFTYQINQIPIAHCYIHPHRNSAESWDIFHAAALEIDNFLQNVAQDHLPIFIIVPDVFRNVWQLAEDGFFTEGARIALAWASAYARFKNLGSLDIRIVVIDELNFQDDIIKTIIDEQLLKPCPQGRTPEEDIQNRIFYFNNIKPVNVLGELVAYQWEKTNKNSSTVHRVVLAELPKNKKRFLMSGAAGFIGSHLCTLLLKDGHQVIGIDNFLCCNTTNINDLKKFDAFSFIQSDITIPFELDCCVDYVVHLASVPSPAYYYTLPRETLLTGLQGTKNMLDIAVKKRAQFLFASTSEVYGDPEISPQPEDYCGNVSPIGKRSQYDQSKRGGETLISLYVQRYGIDARIARIFNTYGPGMQLNDGRVITNFINALLNKKPMLIHGSGMQTRSFAYVSDTIQGIYDLLFADFNQETPLTEKVFNIGNSDEFTIQELAHKMNDLAVQLGIEPAEIINVAQIDATDPQQRCPDLRISRKILNFNPMVSLKLGLLETILYFSK